MPESIHYRAGSEAGKVQVGKERTLGRNHNVPVPLGERALRSVGHQNLCLTKSDIGNGKENEK